MYSVFSLFPELFTFSILAIALLRITAGTFFILLAKRHLHAARAEQRHRRTGIVFALSELVTGILLFVGLFTQAAALAAMALMAFALSLKKQRMSARHRYSCLLLRSASSSSELAHLRSICPCRSTIQTFCCRISRTAPCGDRQ
jgi:hypothetical protein